MKSLTVVFAGTPEFCIPCLNALIHSPHHLKAVYTQPDRPAGRGRKVQGSAVKEWAQKLEIPVYQPLNFKTPEAVAQLRDLNPDILIVIAYGLILPQIVLELPKLGCINVHASLLPRWRGASPIQQAILHGDTQTGVTLMQMDAGMDTGAMLEQVECLIKPEDTAETLHDNLAQIAAKPLLSILDKLASKQIQPTPQDENQVTYAAKIQKEDARINWYLDVAVIDRQIRAFNPWPIAYSQLGDELIRIHEALIMKISEIHAPGTLISIDKNGMLIAAGQGALLVKKIQFPGSKVISISDWINSGKAVLHTGSVLQ